MIHVRAPTTLKRDLQIMAWNAISLLGKLEELREFLVRHKPDVLLINETHLSPLQTRVRLPNYVLFRDDSQVRNPAVRANGGTAMAVKSSIGHHRVTLPPLRHVEATAVELSGVLGGLLLVSAYIPPRSGPFVDDLADIFAAHNKVNHGGRPELQAH